MDRGAVPPLLAAGHWLCCLPAWSRAFYSWQRYAPTPVLGACSEQQSQALSAGAKPAVNLICFKLKPFVLFIGVITVKQLQGSDPPAGGTKCPGGWPLLPCCGRTSPGARSPPLASFLSSLELTTPSATSEVCTGPARAGAHGLEPRPRAQMQSGAFGSSVALNVIP